MAITYLAGNNVAGTASDRASLTTTYLLTGTTFLETDTDDLYMWDGDSWNVIAGDAIAQTFVNKTLTSPVLTTPQINDSATDHQYIFGVANLAADRTINLPLLTGNDTFTFNAFAGTLTNKTIDSDSNTITNIVNADIKASAAIVDTKLATISTGNKVSGSAVQLAGTSALEDSSGLRVKAATAGTGLSLASQVLSVDAAQTQITSVGALNAGSITSGFGTIDTGSSNITTTGTVAAGAVTVTGTLTVNGSTTLINSTIVTIDDPVFTLGGDTAPGSADAKDRGVEFRYFLTGDQARVGFFGFDNSAQVFTGFTAATNSSEVFSGTVMNATFGNIAGTLTTAAQGNITSLSTLTTLAVSGAATVGGSDIVTLAATQTLTAKTLTAPKFADGGFIADAAGLQLIIFDSVSSAVNEVTVANAATGDAPSVKASGETNIGLIISGKGTGGVTLTNATANGAYLEFDTKAAPANPATEAARMYLKQVDANNNAMAVKLQKGGAVVEVEITSPRAVCGECGSKDGAKDPLYDFERGVMVLDLWCGHSFEVPMQWSQINGNN